MPDEKDNTLAFSALAGGHPRKTHSAWPNCQTPLVLLKPLTSVQAVASALAQCLGAPVIDHLGGSTASRATLPKAPRQDPPPGLYATVPLPSLAAFAAMSQYSSGVESAGRTSQRGGASVLLSFVEC